MRRFVLLLLILITGFTSSFSQTIGGIGAQLFLDTAGGFTIPRIMSLVDNSPSIGKLKATDFIMSVNGMSCKNKTIEEVVGVIRGDTGTTVHIVVADTKQGARPREYDLKRVLIQVAAPPAPADPLAAFNAWADDQAKQLGKKGFEVVKTFTSECGNYFFNFNAESGGYRVHVYAMDEKGAGTYTPPFTITAKVYDGNNEPGAVTLSSIPSLESGNIVISQYAGTITFPRDCVGMVGITINKDAAKCKGMYIVVYR